MPAVARVRLDMIVAANRPEVDDFRVAEEGDVDGVVEVVMRHEDMAHVVGRESEPLDRVEDQRAAPDHSGVDDDHAVPVADQPAVPATEGVSA
jgi:hypothetical protein